MPKKEAGLMSATAALHGGSAGVSTAVSDWRRAVLSAVQVARLDADAERLGTSKATLMEAAGRAVADAAAALASDLGAGPIVILCGPGMNGGDGFVAARRLAEQGRMVEVLTLGARDEAAGAQGAAAAQWVALCSTAGRPPWRALETVAPGDVSAEAALVIDALFGVGLSRELSGAAAAFAEASAAPGAPPVLAVDMPSGVCADTGRIRGAAFSATATVTFVRPKRGHVLGPGALRSGAVWVRDIGAPQEALRDAVADDLVTEIAPDAWTSALRKRGVEAHKYDYGHVLTVAGGLGATGAARLSARAALRVGAGLVTVAAPPDAMAECAAQLTAVMLRPAPDAAAVAAMLEDPRLNAVIAGPGLATRGEPETTRALVRAALAGDDASAPRRVALDADALTCWAHPEDLFDAIAAAPRTEVVMTPHGGEFRRLFPDLAARLSGADDPGAPYGKLNAARDAAKRSGAVVLLKGFDTVIAAPDGRAAVHAAIGDRAAPDLATAGAGDVLVGLIAGLGARGWDLFDAASAATWLHVEAARRVGSGLIAEDLPEALPNVLRGL